jgi:hypothetical protein
MVTWRGQTFDTLSRSELETVAQEAVTRMMNLREEQTRRDHSDSVALGVLFGIALALAAIAFGTMLRGFSLG